MADLRPGDDRRQLRRPCWLARVWRSAAPDAAAAFLLGAVAIWIFTQFIQFLVIWSGDKPTEIAWYLHRDRRGAASRPGSASSAALSCRGCCCCPAAHCGVIRLCCRLPPCWSSCAQALGMLWLVTPSVRHHFTISGHGCAGACRHRRHNVGRLPGCRSGVNQAPATARPVCLTPWQGGGAA